jgi:hypothetical protein
VLGIVRNKPMLGETYFEETYNELKEFIEGDKNSANYYVDNDRAQSKYSLKLKKTNITVHLLDDRLYKIPKSNNGEIILTNDKTKQMLTIQIQKNFKDYLRNKYQISEDTSPKNINVNGASLLEFILCFDNNPHNLIMFSRIPILQLLLTDKVELPYQSTQINHCIFTKRIYNDYAYIEVENE